MLSGLGQLPFFVLHKNELHELTTVPYHIFISKPCQGGRSDEKYRPRSFEVRSVFADRMKRYPLSGYCTIHPNFQQ